VFVRSPWRQSGWSPVGSPRWVEEETKTRTRDYNRAKFALNFSFVGLASCSFGHKPVLDTIVIRIRIFTILGLIAVSFWELGLIVQYQLSAVTRYQIFRLKCTKFNFGWGCAPDPTGEALYLDGRHPGFRFWAIILAPINIFCTKFGKKRKVKEAGFV